MKKYDVYVCDICGKEHYLASECLACEKSHEDFMSEVAKRLKKVEE